MNLAEESPQAMDSDKDLIDCQLEILKAGDKLFETSLKDLVVVLIKDQWKDKLKSIMFTKQVA